jgi:replicative DNA helicase
MNNGDKLPNSIDAEKGLLGSILLAPERVMGEQAGLQSADFFHPSNREIFEQLRAMQAESKPIDLISLTQWLDDRKRLDRVGGAAYVTELFNFAPTASNSSYYAEIVREKALRRRVIASANELVASASDTSERDLPSKVKALLSSIDEMPLGNSLRALLSSRRFDVKNLQKSPGLSMKSMSSQFAPRAI